jgi:molybdopterin-guanine dinucleotide biosynthesis protein A
MDALVLAGGRSSRLGSVAKAGLIYEAQTLLERTLDAVAAARSIVVVGPDVPATAGRPVLHAREDPPFGGPVAAIGAGVDALATGEGAQSEYTAVLACDMPHVATALDQLLAALDAEDPGSADGVVATDAGGRLQPLAAVYRTSALRAALDDLKRSGPLDGLSTFQLISRLRLTSVPVSGAGTRDIDTWADADEFGITRSPIKGETMTSPSGNDDVQATREQEDELLRQWCARLVEALGVEGLDVDLKSVLGLAGRAAHSVLRPAAPLTTFVVGYAAGLAAGAGQATSEAAVKSALDVGFQLCRDEMNASSPDHGKP